MLLTWGSSQGLNSLMNSAEFIAGFADAGSGAVDLTLSKGTGSATFTRSTTATTVNSAGLIVNLGLNLCLQSEDLATTWTVGGVTIGANQIVAPDGATTADKLLEDTSTGVHRLIQSITVSSATVYTASLFVKSAERTFAGLFFNDGLTTFAKEFNLTNQATANITGTTAPTSSAIVGYPNGWYRISITFTTTATVGSFQLRMANATDTYSYTGTLNSGMYAWGGQLELGSSATAYAKTTTTANSAPRSYYDPTTLAYLGYLSEGARTNLCLQSQFAASWTASGSGNFTSNSTTAPDGTTTAAKLFETDATNTFHRITGTSYTIAATTAYTVSLFAKQAERSQVRIGLVDGASNGAAAYFNLATGAVVSSGGTGGTPWTSVSATITQYPSGWYRCTLTATSGASTNAANIIDTAVAGSNVYVGAANSGIYIWGSDTEAGSFASTYIPTTTASVTRNADVLTYPSSGNVSATQGTLFGQLAPMAGNGLGSLQSVVSITDGTANESVVLARFLTDVYEQVTDGGVLVVNMTGGSVLNGATGKAAATYRLNDFATTVNGATPVTDTSGTLPTVTEIDVGHISGANQMFGCVKDVRIFQTQLTASQLQAVTS